MRTIVDNSSQIEDVILQTLISSYEGNVPVDGMAHPAKSNPLKSEGSISIEKLLQKKLIIFDFNGCLGDEEGNLRPGVKDFFNYIDELNQINSSVEIRPIKFALASDNSDGIYINKFLEHHGIKKYFSYVSNGIDTISTLACMDSDGEFQIFVVKPLYRICKLLGVDSNEAVMVGDRPDLDGGSAIFHGMDYYQVKSFIPFEEIVYSQSTSAKGLLESFLDLIPSEYRERKSNVNVMISETLDKFDSDVIIGVNLDNRYKKTIFDQNLKDVNEFYDVHINLGNTKFLLCMTRDGTDEIDNSLYEIKYIDVFGTEAIQNIKNVIGNYIFERDIELSSAEGDGYLRIEFKDNIDGLTSNQVSLTVTRSSLTEMLEQVNNVRNKSSNFSI